MAARAYRRWSKCWYRGNFVMTTQDGRIPAFATGGGPDYETGQAVVRIPEESDDYPRTVAAVLPAGTYRIEVGPAYGGNCSG